ncbi:hypothetical protein MMC28_011208 [Mycoblastus sanguinarius]|nr:hypothetical protein [Mycoblastus sanguinarius]
MACFSDLPSELLLAIWEHILPPDDIENFAIVSKTIYSLARPFLQEHRRLRDEFTTITNACDDSYAQFPYYLREILLNPHYALYVQELIIDGWTDSFMSEESDDEHLEHHSDKEYYLCRQDCYSPGDMQLFEWALVDIDCLSAEDRIQCKNLLAQGNQAPTLVILLTAILNLARLTIYRVGTWPDIFWHAVDYMATQAEGTALSKVSHVELRYGRFDNLANVSKLRTLLSLPSLRSILANNMEDGCDEELEFGRHASPARSHLVDLRLCNSAVGSGAIFELLSHVEGLQSFRYESPQFNSPDYFNAFGIRNALLMYAKHSLTSLTLKWCFGPLKAMGTLREFVVLRKVNTDFALLYGEYPGEDCELAYALPSSIEELNLRRLSDVHFEGFLQGVEVSEGLAKLVKGLLIAKVERVPKLQALALGISEDFGRKKLFEDAAIKELCQKMSVHLEETWFGRAAPR